MKSLTLFKHRRKPWDFEIFSFLSVKTLGSTLVQGLDARFLKREFQEEALRKGLIPYIPERPQPVKEDDEDDVE